MQISDFQTYAEFSTAAADFVATQMQSKRKFVLGLCTGSTPTGMYQQLCKYHREGNLSFENTVTFNLDEYLGLCKTHQQSYYHYMHQNLYNNVNLKPENIYIPNGLASDIDKECANYDKAITEHGGLDLMILGIGANGHIGFNEPGDFLVSPSHQTRLSDSTIDANARFFASRDQVPTHALTMGVGKIMQAKKILMLVWGNNKKEVTRAMLDTKVRTTIPATMLLMHPDVTILADKNAH